MSDQNPSTQKLQPSNGSTSAPGDKPAEAANATTGGEGEKKKLPQLGALEDDDEFEEFPAGAEQSGNILDSLAKSGADEHFWEDNWDDDDVEQDFMVTLRNAIKERNGGDETMKE